LTAKGNELFPRQYSLLAQLIVESLERESGSKALSQRLRTLGADVAAQMRAQHPEPQTPQERVVKLSELMEQLGYNTGGVAADRGGEVIEADNCVFHSLAMQNPGICEFDLALLSGFTRLKVDHQECMAKGGRVCRFHFSSDSRTAKPAAASSGRRTLK
jgi:predicted ArsR family transcriptional regulator